MSTVVDAVAAATAEVPRIAPINSPRSTDENGKVLYPYGVFSGALGRGDVYTLDSVHGIRHGRVVLQTFGRTADSAEELMNRTIAKLLDRTLELAGFRATPCRLELDPLMTRDPDDAGVVGLTATLSFTATKETS